MGHAVLADRSEQQASEATVTARTDDDHVCIETSRDERFGGRSLHE
jgi:hypothetical protein